MCLKFLRTLACTILLAFLSRSHAICEEKFQPFRGEINSYNIKIRADATVISPVICEANKGDRLEVIREFFEWYKVRLPKNAPSFIKKNFLVCLQKDDSGQACLTAQVEGMRVNVRLSTDKSAPIIGKANTGDIVNILGEEGGWYKIEPIPASFGWIHKKFLTKIQEPPQPQAMQAQEATKTELLPQPAPTQTEKNQ